MKHRFNAGNGIRTRTAQGNWILSPTCLPFHHTSLIGHVGFEPTLAILVKQLFQLRLNDQIFRIGYMHF